jgi:hypothetical protein
LGKASCKGVSAARVGETDSDSHERAKSFLKIMNQAIRDLVNLIKETFLWTIEISTELDLDIPKLPQIKIRFIKRF